MRKKNGRMREPHRNARIHSFYGGQNEKKWGMRHFPHLYKSCKYLYSYKNLVNILVVYKLTKGSENMEISVLQGHLAQSRVEEHVRKLSKHIIFHLMREIPFNLSHILHSNLLRNWKVWEKMLMKTFIPNY